MPSPAVTIPSLALCLLLLLPGCATAEKPTSAPQVELRPVENRTPRTPEGVYEISKVSKAPRAIPSAMAKPRYPLELRRAGVHGEGVVDFIVGTDGVVRDAVVVRATDVRFGDAALQAVVQWRFEPAEVNGVRVNCRMQVPIVFTLDAR